MPTDYNEILTQIDMANQRKFDKWKLGQTPHSSHEKPSFDSYVKEKIVADYTYDKQTIDQKHLEVVEVL